jgi:hypothetical protein
VEAHRAGVISEAERQLEYHDSTFEDLIAKLQEIPTKVIAEATGYNPRTVRRMKRGDFRPSKGNLLLIYSCKVLESGCVDDTA